MANYLNENYNINIMTKYYLHGGKASVNSEGNKKFFQRLVDGLDTTVNFLCVYFARDRRINKNWNWDVMFEEDKKQISSFCPKTKFNFVLASRDIHDFSKQLKNAHVVFLKGGITPSLYKVLKKIPNLEKSFNGKIIAGSSAGALVLAKYYYDGDYDTYSEGLGILPIKMICHWGEQRHSKLEDLKKFGEELEIYTIPEEKFFIYEKRGK
jgi:hypothetical protein